MRQKPLARPLSAPVKQGHTPRQLERRSHLPEISARVVELNQGQGPRALRHEFPEAQPVI
jgi:hypothetical protein